MNEYKIIYTLYNDKTITSSEKELVINYYGLSLDEESAIDFVKKKIGLNDENDIFTLNKIIKINPNIKNYVETINNLYADLDFIHTILENNSVDIYNLLEELCIDLEYNKGTKIYK